MPFLFIFLVAHAFARPPPRPGPDDTPYHIGNSPGGNWTDFITFLRSSICVKHNKRLFFRSWDNWPSSASVYTSITDPIPTHPLVSHVPASSKSRPCPPPYPSWPSQFNEILHPVPVLAQLYFSIKHTPGAPHVQL